MNEEEDMQPDRIIWAPRGPSTNQRWHDKQWSKPNPKIQKKQIKQKKNPKLTLLVTKKEHCFGNPDDDSRLLQTTEEGFRKDRTYGIQILLSPYRWILRPLTESTSSRKILNLSEYGTWNERTRRLVFWRIWQLRKSEKKKTQEPSSD